MPPARPRNATPDWPTLALGMRELIPRARLHGEVLAWTEGSGADRRRWDVALSGGADSVALLLLLWAHWPERRRRLRVLHFDHGSRGEASRADAVFCAELAESLDLPVCLGRWDRPSTVASEATLRDARLAFFTEKQKGVRRPAVLWFGHQRDDIAESMFMRLARGSGVGGLAAPRPIQAMGDRRVHLRPLLDISRAEIRAVLTALQVPWCEDETNDGDLFFRNRVRQAVLVPWQAAAGRDALAGAALSRELLAEDDAALEHWTDRIFQPMADGSISITAWKDVPVAVVRRALYRWLGLHNLHVILGRSAFTCLLKAVREERSTRQSAGKERFILIKGGVLRVI